MALANKLGIRDSAELARLEEKLSKKKAAELFEKGLLDTFEWGPLRDLQRFINICLMIFMILPDSSELSI